MKLIKQSFEIWEQEPGIIGVFKQIEKAARLSYKSEENITDDSATEFVSRMVNMGHWSTLEHGTVYLVIPQDNPNYHHFLSKYKSNPYSTCCYAVAFNNTPIGNLYITTNYRVLLENKWIEDLKYICGPLEYHAKRVTVKFIMDRINSQSFCRHRVFSFVQESTRWCNYSSNRFGNEITFIKPCSLDDNKLALYGPYHTVIRDKSPESIFIASMNNAEKDYMDLIGLGWKPQQARNVLPNALKTEIAITGFAKDYWGEYWLINKNTNKVDKVIPGRSWKDVNLVPRDMYNVVEKGFFPLRCSKSAHPQVQELIIPLRDKFYELGL